MTARLARQRNDRLVAGVCAGVALRVGLTPMQVRVAFVVGSVLSLGIAAGVYLVLWIALPLEPVA